MGVPTEKEVEIPREGRLDRLLAELLGESRNQIEKLIRSGQVKVDGERVLKSSHRVRAGQRVAYRFVRAVPRESLPVDFDVEVLYEDDALLVLNKPAGVVVHPAPSVREPTLVDWLVERGVSLSTLSGEERHGIVHRLDRETTGALVVAKTNEVHRTLAEELKRREMGRYYLALIDRPLRENLTVEKPIARHPKNRLRMAVVEGGRSAKTDFLKLAEGTNGTELVAARLHTGRTHQIRVHLGAAGRHILGDGLYGFKSRQGKISRVFLHARLLYLTHPVSGKRLEISAPLFDDMREYLGRYYERGTIDELITPTFLSEGFARAFDGVE